MKTWTLSTPGWNDVEIRIYPTRRAMKRAIGEFETSVPRSPMGYHCVLENDNGGYLPLILLNEVDSAENKHTDTVAHECLHAVISLVRIKQGLEVGSSSVLIGKDDEEDICLLQGNLILAIRRALNHESRQSD